MRSEKFWVHLNCVLVHPNEKVSLEPCLHLIKKRKFEQPKFQFLYLDLMFPWYSDTRKYRSPVYNNNIHRHADWSSQGINHLVSGRPPRRLSHIHPSLFFPLNGVGWSRPQDSQTDLSKEPCLFGTTINFSICWLIYSQMKHWKKLLNTVIGQPFSSLHAGDMLISKRHYQRTQMPPDAIG